MARSKKKRHKYKTGTHFSLKNNKKMNFRSSWEEEYMRQLDKNPDVITYRYENLEIPYKIQDPTTNIYKTHKYIPDFLVSYVGNRLEVVEVKPYRKLNDPDVLAKAKYTRKFLETYLSEYDIEYVMVTEKEIFIKREKPSLTPTGRKK